MYLLKPLPKNPKAGETAYAFCPRCVSFLKFRFDGKYWKDNKGHKIKPTDTDLPEAA